MTTETPPTENAGQLPAPLHEFSMRFTSSPRGARLARRLATHRMDAWGYSYGCDANDTVTLIVAELAANAVRHGHVPGRDFSLRLSVTADVVRVEVSDTRGERFPPTNPTPPAPDADSGRGLWLVARLASAWAVAPRPCGPGKTVWADVRFS
ncbi:ATP-binding protein [Streptomyces sp. A3M-1-3]|uniref:ATP-binding protein n=1 Tax=Streptomyces sp. A3M-1-3 TaxID=2962044 RepID=UPI0020B6813D|nr:ATP-binding protein [Streptomyces sp. A3M-1-3]MCP3816745.1 ATP-binding protein [Streptomyces sp. A3M-1-3]